MQSWRARVVCLAGTTALLSGCAVTPAGTATSSAPAAPPVVSSTSTTTSSSPSTSPSPSTTTATKQAKAPAKTAEAYSVTSLSSAQRKKLGSCLSATVSPGSSGACAKKALTMIKAAGLYSGPTSSVGVAGANAILNYQRSRGISPTASVGKVTWAALAANAPAVPKVTPKICLGKGVNLCVDKAHRKMTWYRNGKVVRTFAIRVGGWNSSPKTGKWRVYPTANGTWRVYNKHVNPDSENYGSGAMPYSTMFYPDMYVHYSSGFASQGYSGSSHGCVNIRSLADAKWIFHNTPIGATVFVYGGL